MSAKETYLADIQAQHDIALQRVVDGSVLSCAKSDRPEVEELLSDEEAVSEDDPDFAPSAWAQLAVVPLGVHKAITAAATSERLPPPLEPAKVLSTKIHCSEAERAQVQAWDLDLVQAMHAWCRERMDTVVDGSTPAG